MTTKAATLRITAEQPVRALDADGRRQQCGRRHRRQGQQQTDRHEQQNRIVEVHAERVGTPASLGDQSQRQPHQRAEGRFDGAEINADERQDKD